VSEQNIVTTREPFLQPPIDKHYVRSFLFSRRINAPLAQVHLLARVLLVLCLSGVQLRAINAAHPDPIGACILGVVSLLLFIGIGAMIDFGPLLSNPKLMVFGAASLYLVLKVGLTVSASIPVAVISLAIFRGLSKLGVRDASILENNITQTAGSAGESIAFGIGVTMPAILILGFDLELMRIMLVAVLGGLLGILMMIPLRRTHIVEDHGKLKYPEGTACAAVLKAGANAADRAAASPSAQAAMRAARASLEHGAPSTQRATTRSPGRRAPSRRSPSLRRTSACCAAEAPSGSGRSGTSIS